MRTGARGPAREATQYIARPMARVEAEEEEEGEEEEEEAKRKVQLPRQRAASSGPSRR